MTAFTNVVSVREVEGNARRKQNPHPDSWFVCGDFARKNPAYLFDPPISEQKPGNQRSLVSGSIRNPSTFSVSHSPCNPSYQGRIALQLPTRSSKCCEGKGSTTVFSRCPSLAPISCSELTQSVPRTAWLLPLDHHPRSPAPSPTVLSRPPKSSVTSMPHLTRSTCLTCPPISPHIPRL